MDPEIRSQALEALKVARCSCDLFANRANAQELHYIDRREKAWTFHWGILSKGCPAWANPPFSKLLQVVTNIVLDDARVVLCTPDWGTADWRELLDKVTVQRVMLPNVDLYICTKDGEKKPPPRWRSIVSLTEGSRVLLEELDPVVFQQVLKLHKGKDGSTCYAMPKLTRPWMLSPWRGD